MREICTDHFVVQTTLKAYHTSGVSLLLPSSVCIIMYVYNYVRMHVCYLYNILFISGIVINVKSIISEHSDDVNQVCVRVYVCTYV